MSSSVDADAVQFLAPGEPVDLDNCAREPIHIPGLIQPRGALLVVRQHDGEVLQASANLRDLTSTRHEDAVGQHLRVVLGDDADLLLDHARRHEDLASRNPVPVRAPQPGTPPLDAVLHRPPLPEGVDGVVVVELERATSARPLEFSSTYRSVREALGDLERAATLDALFEATARHVRTLTGFDRVMIYRFDQDYNGEVVAEARTPALNAFLGLHYPASDIPAQARALYEKNWIRLIADVGYEAVPVVPTDLPVTGQPLDLTYSTLRSVSPIHLEYLGNMGVRASMSISLLRDGKLWGLIACHHYAGPHEPPYEVRTAAEFLGSTLSVRLVAQAEEERAAATTRSAALLAELVATSTDEDTPLATLLTQDDRLVDALGADGAVVLAEGRVAGRGEAPGDARAARLLDWVAADGGEVVATDSLARDAPELASALPDVAGVLAVALPDRQAVVWLRGEVQRTVDWGGDPHNKAIARREGAEVRLSPRKSFERWREIVGGRSVAWSSAELESAHALRRHLVEVLYRRGRREVRATESLQRSLLPDVLPQPDGWTVDARYDAAGSGLVGGDWYDALVLPDGRLGLVVGDVTGHGLRAAAAMGQLRNALRAALVTGTSLQGALEDLAALAGWTMPQQVATLAVVLVRPDDGTFEYASMGHLPGLVADGERRVRWLEQLGTRPLGVGVASVVVGTGAIPPGGLLALFTDGLVERRTESVRAGMSRLARTVSRHEATSVDDFVARVRDPASTDDATLLLVRRTGTSGVGTDGREDGTAARR
ncbi:MAG TPA: SpoIIE family protein phosphatase [Luteimicrobium sp.]|nr:SpoIIE family protein phosphatase [Luteimicrobium sp.]